MKSYPIVTAIIIAAFISSSVRADDLDLTLRSADEEIEAKHSFEVRIYEETPASLGSDSELSDDKKSEEGLRPVKDEELEYLSAEDTRECTSKFQAPINLVRVQGAVSEHELGSNDILAIKVASAKKSLRIDLNFPLLHPLNTGMSSAQLKGVCLIYAGAGLRSSVHVFGSAVDQFAVVDRSEQSFTNILIGEDSRITRLELSKLASKSSLTVLGTGLLFCPRSDERRLHCRKASSSS